METFRIQYRDFSESEAVTKVIREKAEKLRRFCDRIISCQVVVSAPHRHQHHGRIFHIQVRIHVPGREIVVSRETEKDFSHENIYLAIRDAFKAARRELEDFVRVERGVLKEDNLPYRARVKMLNNFEGFGFLEAADHREIYFHENSVLQGQFSGLHVGDEVSFNEEMGEKGPQATSVRLVGKQGHKFDEMGLKII